MIALTPQTCEAMLHDSEARGQPLAPQLTEYQETVASQEETIKRLAEGGPVVKRNLFRFGPAEDGLVAQTRNKFRVTRVEGGPSV